MDPLFPASETALTFNVRRVRLPAIKLPNLTHHAEVTDAYLVELARAHGLKLATLDHALCQKPWAAGIAENPL